MTKFVEKVEPTTFKWRYKNFDTFYISLASMVLHYTTCECRCNVCEYKIEFFYQWTNHITSGISITGVQNSYFMTGQIFFTYPRAKVDICPFPLKKRKKKFEFFFLICIRFVWFSLYVHQNFFKYSF